MCLGACTHGKGKIEKQTENVIEKANIKYFVVNVKRIFNYGRI